MEGKGFTRILSVPGGSPEQGSLLEPQTKKWPRVALCMTCVGDGCLHEPVHVCL